MKMARFLLIVIGLMFLTEMSVGQTVDTLPPGPKGTLFKAPVKSADTLPRRDSSVKRRHRTDSPYKVDSLARRGRDPRKATLYSTFFPGLGQIYNKKYWKVPLVWAAVGIPAYTYFYNRSWYNKCQGAISIINDYRAQNIPIPDNVINSVDPKLRAFLSAGDDNSLRSYRNQYRKDEDYSILFFILFWGLNIVDATVDAHLASFDVGSELSFHFDQPSTNALAVGPMGRGVGLSLVVDFHKAKYKPLALLP
ncbi:MAG TPA: DUF5683 domain-containing protein [Puia sp.]|jgi:hypothetical protein|nr:DUF5683 domain-containing protein [Puia sp.]